MSDIVLSSSVRQNLLSLQSTADLLATTQTRLATGKKVNSALDNPTNFFTAAGLDARASDINNLLDGIGNGVQVLQAANTGISSLQKLVDTAKSIANQALQTTVGYSQKSTITSTAITGATADNLLGTPDTAATLTGTATGTLAAASALTAAAGGSFAAGDTLIVNGTTINITAAGTGTAASTTAADGSINLNTTATTAATTDDLTAAIKTALGGGSADASIAANKLTLTAGNTSDSITLGGTALSKVGLTAGSTAPTSSFVGQTLTIGSTGGGTASNITFGTGTGQVSTLNQLNSALAANNLQASLSTDGKLSITTTNDFASATVGTVGGTAFASGGLLGTTAPTAADPVADPAAQATRANLVTQYNTVIDQIRTTAQDASFNGVNLLNGDQLRLVFNETGKSTLNITGVTFDPAGLGLGNLTSGTDFVDNSATNKVLDSLNNASSTLRSQASALGSNLSVVQIRQDFSKNLINVLQTGSSNLTLADTNEEAANSQALSTRQSIAVSALALANQSQQGVLQLLR
ncbi:MAG: flagellar protein [Xanthobacteraceae bacterium]|nr:flagellar protein [Xanthobacteraceae bacterium]